MRTYQPAWNQLRDNPSSPLVISAHPAYHRRIYKAICKEKHLDTVWAMLMADAGKLAKLSKHSNGNALTITLNITISINQMF